MCWTDSTETIENNSSVSIALCAPSENFRRDTPCVLMCPFPFSGTLYSHVNKRGIRGIQDSRHSGVLPGTFLKINGILHWLNTDVVYAFQILELYLPAIDGSLICMAALYKVPARPCFRWAAIEYITIKSFVTIFLIVTKYAILSRLLDCRELRAFPGTFFGRIPGTLNF